MESTGERSFAAVAERVKDLATREILEAGVRTSKLMEAKVCEEDVIGLRHNARTLFVKTNFVLRNKGKTSGGTNYSSCSTRTKVSNYSNLIYAIVSGLSKLSQVSGIPEHRELYHGVGDMHLPARFYEEHDTGARGGVGRGMLSTTTDKKVATFTLRGGNCRVAAQGKARLAQGGLAQAQGGLAQAQRQARCEGMRELWRQAGARRSLLEPCLSARSEGKVRRNPDAGAATRGLFALLPLCNMDALRGPASRQGISNLKFIPRCQVAEPGGS